jgi:PAS domain S-box-containing protein
MSGSPSALIWGIIAIIAVLLILAVSILAAVVIHARKIKESENRFSLLFDRVFDLLILIDNLGQVIDVNASACHQLGIPKLEMKKLNINDLQGEDDADKMRLEIARILKNGTEFIGDTSLTKSDGTVLWVEGAGVRFEHSDKIFIILSFRNVTERKQADEALRVERESLKEKNIALKEVLHYIEEEKAGIKRGVADKVEQVILPTLKKMISIKGSVDKIYYNSLLDELQGLTGSTTGIPHLLFRLSPREIEICKLLKTGASTKEIAETLNITVTTVQKHRERIRNRLGLAHKDINLTTFLQSQENK